MGGGKIWPRQKNWKRGGLSQGGGTTLEGIGPKTHRIIGGGNEKKNRGPNLRWKARTKRQEKQSLAGIPKGKKMKGMVG